MTGTVSIFCHVPAAEVATALNRNTGQAHPVCTGLTHAVEAHEFFNQLWEHIVHALGSTCISSTVLDIYESEHCILMLKSLTCSRACGKKITGL